jgi:hypothetical protein
VNKLIGDVIAAAKLKDGAEVEIRFDTHHYRAYNVEEQQVGPERVVLDSLLAEIGGTLIMNSGIGADIKAKENIAGGRDQAVLGAEADVINERTSPDVPLVEIPASDAQPGPGEQDAQPGPEVQNLDISGATPGQPDEEGGDPRVH